MVRRKVQIVSEKLSLRGLMDTSVHVTWMGIGSGIVLTAQVKNFQSSQPDPVGGPSKFCVHGVDLSSCSSACCKQHSCTENSRSDGEQSVEDNGKECMVRTNP